MSHIITGSGYLNSPVRTLIIADDNRPGSYPVEMSPIAASRSGQFMRPYRDNVMPDTPVVYGQSRVIFNDIPADGTSITLTDATSTAHQFTFRSEFPNSLVAPNTINTFELVDGTDRYQGRTPGESSIRKLAMRFIDAINGATGTLIVASPTGKYNEVLLTQQIPGIAGNTTNSSTTTAVTVRNFTGGNSGTVRYPFGISLGNGISAHGAEIAQRLINTEQSGTLDVPASGKASRAGAYSDQHFYASFEPYNESSATQAFGAQEGSREYGTKTRLYDDFFTRGSTSGNLDEPLWNKDKIEIDLSPVEETTLRFTNGTTHGQNYPMAYYNLQQKKWEPIGFGEGVISSSPSTLQDVLEDQYIGFSQGFENLLADSNGSGVSIIDPQLQSEYTNSKKVFREAGWLSPIDTFGFPLHPKYHATGSQTLDVSSLVNRPFLVEKIIYECSLSFSSNNAFVSNEYEGTGGVFFILNQRKANPDPGQETSYTSVYVSENNVKEFSTPQSGDSFLNLPYNNGGIPRNIQLSPGASTTYVDSVRDLVTFARFGTVWPSYETQINNLLEPGFPHPANFMDLAIELPNSPSTFSGECTIAAPIRAPSQNSAVSNILIGDNMMGTIFVSPNNIKSIYSSKISSTRNSLDIATGRSYRNEFVCPEISYTVSGYNLSEKVFAPKSDNISSPYIIRPGDKLIFGWQSPMSFSLSRSGPSISLLPGKGKLTLYGSYLQDNKPIHDIYKDQLNSDAVHESVPSGPWALDRFETDPQMCYTGSMREMYVTGTMLSIGPNGRYTIPSESVLNIGSLGVRAVAATVSSGNVKQRWSFFRNVRLADSEEQYYDSMQPNTFDWLMRPGVIGMENSYFFSVVPLLNFVPIVVPGDQILDPTRAHIQTGSNRELIGSFPFEPRYSEIPRVKSINSRILTERKVKVYNLAGAIVREGGFTGGLLFFPSQNTSGVAQFSKSNLLRNGGIAKSVPIDTSGAPKPWGLEVNAGIMPCVENNDSKDTNPVLGSIINPSLPAFNKMPLAFSNLVQRNTSVTNNIASNFHLSRFLGCFGPGYMGMVQLENFISSNVGGSDSYIQGTTFVYRGAKHGLINPTPLFTNAVFNGTHFGQFRDLLEQRQYTRFSLSDSTLTNSVVEVLFIDRNSPPGTLTITSGSATNSSNVSPFATSEHPYDDSLSSYGQIWDRQTTLPEVLAVLPP